MSGFCPHSGASTASSSSSSSCPFAAVAASTAAPTPAPVAKQPTPPLSAEEIALVKATVPILESDGAEALTKLFYKNMFASHPEVRTFFNQAHQRSGEQPRALLHSVLMYAKHIDNLAPLGELVTKIAHKHCSVLVTPQQYPVVGTNLLRAMRELLGEEIASDALLAAWAHAYQLLADILIGVEEDMYHKTEVTEGGWRGARPFTVAKKVEESNGIVSFYLRPTDNKRVAVQLPGQYVCILLDVTNSDGQKETIRRNYSLSALSDGFEYRISVKREENGVSSGFLHESVKVGDEVQLSAPAGDFVLSVNNNNSNGSGGPVVMLAGGVGITPMLPMIEQCEKVLNNNRPLHLVQCVRELDSRPFAMEIDSFVRNNANLRVTAWASRGLQGRGHLNSSSLGALLAENSFKPSEAEFFITGPKTFMEDMREALLAMGVCKDNVKYETFGPETKIVR